MESNKNETTKEITSPAVSSQETKSQDIQYAVARPENTSIFERHPERDSLLNRFRFKRDEHQNKGKSLHVWFRHSGQEQIDQLPHVRDIKYRRTRDEAEITAKIGDHHITHLMVWGNLPTLKSIGSHITHIEIEGLSDLTQLDRLKELKQLKVLHFYGCNFSTGLPLVITQLTSLKKLKLWRCQLTELPSELANLSQLQELHLDNNNFSRELPLVVTKMTSLNKLALHSCQLKEIPAEFAQLQELRELNLSMNKFTGLSPSVCRLTKLQTLDVAHNRLLKCIEKEILQLVNLATLRWGGCHSLTYPPYAVRSQGLHAVRKYLADLNQSTEIKRSSVPVAVVGASLSGKTSLIRSLQNEERQLTFRDAVSPKDETTKVFKIEDLHFDKFAVKFVDYGGQDIYHVAYNIAKKDHCLPVAVVNMKEFSNLANAKGSKEATKKLVFDWLSHLYVACPTLGPPLVALTHTDELTPTATKQCREDLLKKAEEIRNEILEEEDQLSASFPQTFQNIDHFKQTDVPLIHPADVFEFDNNREKTENISKMLSSLEERCIAASTVIPEQWDEVAKFLENNSGFHLNLSEVAEKFQMDGLDVVLRYLHNCGAILWFKEHSQLSGYIFHNMPAVVDMIALLFHHSADEQWKESVENYKAFFHNKELIEKERYKRMVEEFTQSGVMAEILLVSVLKKHKFPNKIALDLLQSFQILHGPMEHKRTPHYVIPCFAKDVAPAGWESDGRLQLRLDMLFKGLSPPKYIFHLITVDVLNFVASPLSITDIWKNGATVRFGDCAIHLLHDYVSMKITLQVSTPVKKLGMSWKKLLETTAHEVNTLQQTWPASRIETQVYCAHCLFVGEQTPSCVAHPDWLYSEGNIDVNNIETFPGVELVACQNSRNGDNRLVPAVPCPLVYPCYDMSEDDVYVLENYLGELKVKRPPQGQVLSAEVSLGGGNSASAVPKSSTATQGEVQPKEVPRDKSDVSSIVLGPSTASHSPQPNLQSADDDSELSDNIDYLDEKTEMMDNIRLRINSVTRRDIMKLFTSDTVYKMSSPIRGRCLIINNKQFEEPTARDQVELSDRPGSEMDVKNLKGVFRQLAFEWDTVYNDLSSQDMLRVIKEETQHPDHTNYGMFVLVIMTHGNATHLYGSDGRAINLSEVYDLMAPYLFKRMAGKPKWLIIQACSGGRKDMMGEYSSDSFIPSVVPPVHSLPAQQSMEEPEPLVHLATDDMFIMKASFYSYVSTRHPRNGTWFVRALVEALLKHSNHRDVQTLFEKQVKKKVRAKSIACHRQYGQTGGQQPTMECFPTKDRKLYLFPGYKTRI